MLQPKSKASVERRMGPQERPGRRIGKGKSKGRGKAKGKDQSKGKARVSATAKARAELGDRCNHPELVVHIPADLDLEGGSGRPSSVLAQRSPLPAG